MALCCKVHLGVQPRLKFRRKKGEPYEISICPKPKLKLRNYFSFWYMLMPIYASILNTWGSNKIGWTYVVEDILKTIDATIAMTNLSLSWSHVSIWTASFRGCQLQFQNQKIQRYRQWFNDVILIDSRYVLMRKLHCIPTNREERWKKDIFLSV